VYPRVTHLRVFPSVTTKRKSKNISGVEPKAHEVNRVSQPTPIIIETSKKKEDLAICTVRPRPVFRCLVAHQPRLEPAGTARAGKVMRGGENKMEIMDKNRRAKSQTTLALQQQQPQQPAMK
jgi:hypothetical protein